MFERSNKKSPSIQSWAPVATILALSFAVRIGYLLARPMVIEAEGAYYARVAENLAAGIGWVGIHQSGLLLLYPPLFPLLIAAVHLLVGNVELAARLVSLFFGSALVVPVFLIAREMYGQRVGYVAGLITALHPVMVGMSTAVYSEVTYLFLLFSGIFYATRSAREQSCWKAVAAGVLFGLAYLTRAEALVTACLLVTVILLCDWRDKRRAISVAACLILACGILVVPNVWFLKVHTGQFRLETKSTINFAVGQMVLAGMTPTQAYRLVGDNLNPVGVSMRSNLDVMQKTRFSVPAAIRFAKFIAPLRIRQAISVLFEHQAVGGVVLIGLVTMGLLGSAWDEKRVIQEGIVVVFLGCLFLPLFSLDGFSSRFLVVFLPVLIIWSAKGAEEVGNWTAKSLANILPTVRGLNYASVLGSSAAIGVLLAVSWITIGGFEDLQRNDVALKTAALEVRKMSPSGRAIIMDMDPLVAFYAGGILQPFPYAKEKTALRYIAANQVNFLVLRENLESDIPYYHDWAKKGIPGSDATLVANVPSAKYGEIRVYRWH